MDITKRDSKMLKGVAIISMLMLHLFCRKENLPYTPLLWIGNTPLVYYLGLFGDICVSVYCFISGYAHLLQSSNADIKKRAKRILKFLIRFWVIVVLFSGMGIVFGNPNIPGDGLNFLLHCLTLKNSYNGAWWYAHTYIILVILQPLSCKFAQKCPSWFVALVSFGFYVFGYGIRFWGWCACDATISSWIISHIGLLGTSYFPYMIGMLFCKHQVIATLRRSIESIKLHNIYIYIYILSSLLLIGMIVAHGIVPSLFVAVATAVVTIIIACLCPMPKWLSNILCYMGDHSTNIWLTHMFFYSVLWNDLVFCAKYPALIFLFLIILSLIASYVINFISNPILKLVR